jgi:DNA repair exonuclease SbcCD ATPase subunit
MADQNITYKIIVDSEAGTATLRDLQGRIVANQVHLQELRKEFGNFAQTVNATDFNKFKSGLDSAVKSQQALQNSMQQTSAKTGAATSAVLELGRVVQDAPYGIRGMANNITQLVTQVSFATVSAGSFTAALRAMWSALMGPLGIVLAISAVVSALDYFYGGQKKAKDIAGDTTDALEEQRKKLSELTDGYEDYIKVKEKVFMTTAKEREMLKALVKETLDLTNSDERRTASLNKLIELYPKYFKGLNVDSLKGLSNAEEDVNRVLQNREKLQDALNRAEILSNDIQLERISLQKLQDEGKRPSTERFDSLVREQEKVRELIGVYAGLDLTLKEDEKKKGSSDKRDRVKALFDFPTPAEVLAYSKKLLDAVARGFGVDMKENPLSIKPELDFTLSDEAKARIDSYTKSVRD